MNYEDIKAPSRPTKNMAPGLKEERTDLGDIGPFVTPKADCSCKTCRYRYPGILGWRNGNCFKYKKEKGKPSDILFKGVKCAYYRIDRSDEQEAKENGDSD